MTKKGSKNWWCEESVYLTLKDIIWTEISPFFFFFCFPSRVGTQEFRRLWQRLPNRQNALTKILVGSKNIFEWPPERLLKDGNRSQGKFGRISPERKGRRILNLLIMSSSFEKIEWRDVHQALPEAFGCGPVFWQRLIEAWDSYIVSYDTLSCRYLSPTRTCRAFIQ